MGNNANHMKLGLFVRPVGHHVASWRHPDSHADAGVTSSDLSRWRRPRSAAFIARPHVGAGVTKAALDAACLAERRFSDRSRRLDQRYGTVRSVNTYVEAVQEFRAHPHAAKAFLVHHLRFDADIVERVYEFYRSLFQTGLRSTLPNIQLAIDQIAKQRPEAARITPADLIDSRFLEEIGSA